ncbi:GNAT family N-acetyltransferase [Mucilaginibacter pocheonensis]|uniref:Ribosomal protein S18 acetylase RimI-like enzyme n=1 Tax=Mucilaginibacter pocheonensis TaxID=398050 RepID=A0ABU1TD14_9SPHI|nr:GNAT family N-acetyltransferase [Mucilaginibacter pocheonensis]MDR6943287.1 ribosomal protein S18 acetylase RimI-like enzyme [Mucilaginibacter pocheonensis]
MEIKQINVADYLLVTRLFNQYRIFYKQPSDMALAETFIKNRLENNESVIFAAIDHGEAVGFTQLYPLFSSVKATKNWLLNDLFVDADHRKQGIGEALLKAAAGFAKTHGATFLQLETAVDNYTAQSLYEATGFVKQDANTTSFYYRKAI